MATVLGITDRDFWYAGTDNLVVVDPEKKTALWVPRDMWCAGIKNRVNVAYRDGQHDGLRRALDELGLRADYSVVALRSAAKRILDRVDVELPVTRLLRFRYPLVPDQPIEAGERVIEFRPPKERIFGEKVHWWVGARYCVNVPSESSDFSRIRRQIALLRKLIKDGFDFSSFVGEDVRVSDPRALDELRQVRGDWTFDMLDGVKDAVIRGMMVLIRKI